MLQKPEIPVAAEQAAASPAAAEPPAETAARVQADESLPEAKNSAVAPSDDPDQPGLLAESPEADAPDNEDATPEEPLAISSGGEGEYRDFPGTLVGGVERLGSLPGAAGATISFAPLHDNGPPAGMHGKALSFTPGSGANNGNAVPGGDNTAPGDGGGSNGGGDDGDITPYQGNSRFVMLLEPSDLASLRSGPMTFALPQEWSMTGFAQANWMPADTAYAPEMEYGYGTAAFDTRGMVVFTLDPEYETQVKNGARLLDYISYKDIYGDPHVIEVVISCSSNFTSYDPTLMQDMYCETHYGTMADGGYNVTSGRGNNMFLYGKFDNSQLVTGDDSDRVRIREDFSDSTISLGSVRGGLSTAGSGDSNVLLATGSVTGSAIYGDAGADRLVVRGQLVDSSIDAGGGNDSIIIDNSLNAASIRGGTGSDNVTITGDLVNVSAVFLGQGNNATNADSTDSNANSVTITGNITGAAVYGDAGADTVSVNGSLGNSRIDAGGGNNSITVGGNLLSSSVLQAEGGDDTFLVSGGVTGSYINTGDGNNSVTIDGTVSAGSQITSGTENDSFQVGGQLANSTLNAGGGNDTIIIDSGLNAASIRGGKDSDSVTITGDLVNVSAVFLGQGLAGTNADSTDTASNSVTITGSITGSAVYGDAGTDTVSVGGSLGNSRIDAGGGNNSITVGNDLLGNSVLQAGGGDDTILVHGVGTGSSINTGDGANSVTVQQDVANSKIYGGSGADSFLIREDFTNSGLEAGNGNNSITIDGDVSASSQITTGTGNDSVQIGGQLANSTINAGDGNDAIIIGNGLNAASIRGGKGSDSVTITGDLVNVSTVFLGQGLNGTNTDSTDTGSNSVTLNGALNGSSIFGDAGDDTVWVTGLATHFGIRTGAGDDLLIMQGGLQGGPTGYSSQIYTGDGNDRIMLSGNMSGDSSRAYTRFYAEGGDDTIILDGLADKILLDGGSGMDYLVLKAADLSEFQTRYTTLLTSNAYNIGGIEHIQFSLADNTSDDDILNWMASQGIMRLPRGDYGGTPIATEFTVPASASAFSSDAAPSLNTPEPSSARSLLHATELPPVGPTETGDCSLSELLQLYAQTGGV